MRCATAVSHIQPPPHQTNVLHANWMGLHSQYSKMEGGGLISFHAINLAPAIKL